MSWPVLSGGKRKGRAAVASVSAGSLTLHDAKTNRAFLIDTGAEVSLVPANEQEHQGAPWKKELVAANRSRIRCYGEKKLRLHVGPRVYEWTFLVADKHFVIQCGERQESVSVDRLKAARSDPDRQTTPAVPPRRGRPPKQQPEPTAQASPAGIQEQGSETEPEPQPPTYAQVTRRGRAIKPPERYIAVTGEQSPDKTR